VMSLRYHVVSLAAIFVALGIGILLGAAMSGDEGLAGQQRALIERLDADFYRLSQDRDALAQELEAARKYVEESVPYVVRGSLLGKTVGIVAVSGVGASDLDSVKRVCEIAGARVGAVVDLASGALSNANDGQLIVWTQAILSSDIDRIGSLASQGIAKVTMAEDCRFNALVALCGPAEAAESRFVEALSATAKGVGIPFVVGWTRTAALKARSETAGAMPGSQFEKGPPSAEVYGVGTASGNAALALALAGARGTYGQPPAPLALPAREGK